ESASEMVGSKLSYRWSPTSVAPSGSSFRSNSHASSNSAANCRLDADSAETNVALEPSAIDATTVATTNRNRIDLIDCFLPEVTDSPIPQTPGELARTAPLSPTNIDVVRPRRAT